jgi:hypothetical protein
VAERVAMPVEACGTAAGRWCPICCTDHPAQARCPGELPATGPERHAWRVSVETPRGMQGYGVLVAPSGERWRSRILTYPNVLWVVPGGAGTLKFTGRTAEEAERKAMTFIREHCVAKGYLMRDDIAPVGAGESAPRAQGPQHPRYLRSLPVRFGHNRPTIRGATRDLSEGGLFVVTDVPVSPGAQLGLLLELEYGPVPLRGAVAWSQAAARAGRPAGMGVKLLDPPTIYVRYVRALS